MRLIDADALKYEPLPKGDRNYRTYNLDDAYDDGYDDAFVDVRNAPTVDAIPIGWIEEQIRESYDASKEYDGCYDYAWYLSELVKRWRERMVRLIDADYKYDNEE